MQDRKRRYFGIDWKLSLAIVGLGSLIATSVGVGAYWTASASLEQQARDRMTLALNGHKSALETYLQSIREDLHFVASHPWTLSAVSDFHQAWEELGGNQTKTLQDLYITNNPHPLGSKEKLDKASDASSYSRMHATYHPWFRKFLQERGYYDIFLFDLDGHLVYSVFKELDYATNLNTGIYKDTDLGNAFRQALSGPESLEDHFFDFRPYAPSNGAPASFISKPILDADGKPAGVLAFQMPIERINTLVQKSAGMGVSGETLLVGDDRLMRTQSRFFEDNTILQKRVEGEAVERALAGDVGTIDVISPFGKPAIAAYAPFKFLGVTWAMIAEMDTEEALLPAETLLWRVVAITGCALLLLAFAGWLIGRNIALPLKKLVTTVADLARGDRVDIPGADRRDEIGKLAQSLDQVYRKGLEAARLKAALDCCQANVMVANRSLEIVYLNPNLQRLLKTAEADIRKDLPHFAADQLLGSNIDMFHKNPAYQQNMLANLRAAHTADIDIGGRKLVLTVSPVLSDKGEHLGTVVEWQDQTVELAIQQEIDDVVAAVNRGDLSLRLQLDGKQGFMLGLAKGINQLAGMIDGVTSDLGAVLEGLAQGDLRKKIANDYLGRFGELKQNANDTIDQLIKTVSFIKSTAAEVQNASQEISAGTDDLSSRTEHAAANVEETAAASEQMSSTVKQNAENAGNADQLAGSANDVASQGGRIVEQAVEAMSGIEMSAQKITDIIVVIDEIAFQTNLLALNASVEAARAGESGKGFAVVAQEVRQLAQRAAEASNDIKRLIQESNGQVKSGVQLVNQAGEALAEIVGSIGQVASIVQEISNASQEQAIGVQEINRSITTMDDMTQQNSSLVEESAASARSLTSQAVKLNEAIAFFKLDDRISPSHQRPTKPRTEQPAKTAPVARSTMAEVPAMATGSHDDWSEF